MTGEHNLLIKLTFMSAVVKENQLQVEGNVCAANLTLGARLVGENVLLALEN